MKSILEVFTQGNTKEKLAVIADLAYYREGDR
ncbi:hypothetical protein G866_00935 [Escherichia coli HVH 214 (4-3062198)]|nr:hypothetical protein G866_00935 [Escherichia coli HVH 214 (4-3062198)]